MEAKTRSVARFLAAVAILAIATLGLAGCKADHWIVIHDKAVKGTCKPPMENDDIAYLPECLTVKNGETVGFANFTKKDLAIVHFSALDAPNPFTLKAGERAVHKVIAPAKLVQLEIKEIEPGLDHGGPDMIVQP
jgi:hypothetical protein